MKGLAVRIDELTGSPSGLRSLPPTPMILRRPYHTADLRARLEVALNDRPGSWPRSQWKPLIGMRLLPNASNLV